MAGAVTREGGCALLTEAHALDPELPLARALGFWAALDGARGAVTPALAALGLDTLADVPVRMLSTGQRRRAAMARVVSSGADLWLLDEPANGLDEGAVGTLEALIADHRKAGGIVLVATHLPIHLPGAAPIALGGAA
jgi:heme exporter protein A